MLTRFHIKVMYQLPSQVTIRDKLFLTVDMVLLLRRRGVCEFEVPKILRPLTHPNVDARWILHLRGTSTIHELPHRVWVFCSTIRSHLFYCCFQVLWHRCILQVANHFRGSCSSFKTFESVILLQTFLKQGYHKLLSNFVESLEKSLPQHYNNYANRF